MGLSDDKSVYEAMVKLCEDNIPGFKVGFKDKESLDKFIGRVIKPFNDDYMTRYTTTRGTGVFFPSEEFVKSDYKGAWKILAHEYVHLWDIQKSKLFNFKYAAPQILGLVAFGAIGAFWFKPLLWCLASLAFLLPLPSPGRARAEERGYSMSIAINFWRYGSVGDSTKEYIMRHFTDSSYYFMWPFKKHVRERMRVLLRRLKLNTFLKLEDAEPFVQVFNLLTVHGLNKST